MGLDLLVEGCAKPGQEREWRSLIERAFGDPLGFSDDDKARFKEVSIPAFERLDAPRVGQDAAATAWMFEKQGAETPEAQAALLKDFDGYHVVALVQSDGVPKYSHGGLYDGVDETSFRGSFLELAGDVLDKRLIRDAWKNKLPEAAVAYGRALLDAADAAAARGAQPASPPRRGLLSALGFGRKAASDMTFEEQLDVVRTCGRWYVFWGERGHAITAWS